MVHQNSLSLRERVIRSFRQSRENKFAWQELCETAAESLKKAPGLPLAIIGVLGLNEDRAADIFTFFERYLPFFIIALLAPYLISASTFALSLIVRFKETYAGEARKVAAGIPVCESVDRFLTANEVSNLAIAGAIEVLRYPFLDKRISNNGWDPKVVEIKLSRKEFNIPDRLLGGSPPVGDDNTKYALVGSSRPTTDDYSRLCLEVAPTSFYEIESVRRLTDQQENLRHEFSSITPELHKIPSSLCLHGVVLFSDNKVLAMKRRSETTYFPNAVSVSFEEQLAQIDFSTPGISPSESLFRRAICEEIFPLANRYEIDPIDTWNRVSNFIDHYRYWSLLFEENTGNYSLFGVCKLKLSLAEYISEFSRIQAEYAGIRDDEGILSYMTLENLRDYLSSGHGEIKRINMRDPERTGTEPIRSAHPTMPYRAATLMSCL